MIVLSFRASVRVYWKVGAPCLVSTDIWPVRVSVWMAVRSASADGMRVANVDMISLVELPDRLEMIWLPAVAVVRTSSDSMATSFGSSFAFLRVCIIDQRSDFFSIFISPY